MLDSRVGKAGGVDDNTGGYEGERVLRQRRKRVGPKPVDDNGFLGATIPTHNPHILVHTSGNELLYLSYSTTSRLITASASRVPGMNAV